MVADASDGLSKNGTVRLNGKVNGIHKHTNGHKPNGKSKKVINWLFLYNNNCSSLFSGDHVIMSSPDQPMLGGPA